jgi:heme-degrading monooxygenase HmoA
MKRYHIAEVNIGRVRASLEDESMQGFVSRLDEINELAERSPGFVWRLKSDVGPSSYLKPYDDERILVNLSVWESVEALKDYTYRTAHAEVLRDRKSWFEKFEGVFLALWWVPVGHTPSVDEAKQRLAHLEQHGPSQFAFTFKSVMPPDESFLAALDWSIFAPCPATS